MALLYSKMASQSVCGSVGRLLGDLPKFLHRRNAHHFCENRNHATLRTRETEGQGLRMKSSHERHSTGKTYMATSPNYHLTVRDNYLFSQKQY
jgi:hypothetical protein